MKRLTPICSGIMSVVALTLWGAQVHVTWQTSTDGEVKERGDVLANTDEAYTTCEAPRIEGYVFTGWTIDTKQSFVSRDAWGRSLDKVSIVVYEPTVLTANYHQESIDTDADGLCDAKELYWYGNLDHDQYSDTDGDGFTLIEEFAQGLNPHLPNRSFKGVATADGVVTDYNPNDYPKLVVGCEPDGELFATSASYVRPGETVTTQGFDPYATRFAYWAINGVRQTDAVGQALNAVSFVMPSNDVIVMAVCEMAYENRARLHWYGDDEVSLESDSDGDGRTLAEELAAGTNPLLKDRTVSRGVTYAQTGVVDYNPNSYPTLKIVCDPEGVLFKDSSRYVAVGSSVVSPFCRYSDGFMGWTRNGVRQHDVLGRALDEVSFDMPNEDVELIASSTADADEQMQMYWYGDEWVSVDSDTDGDGYSLAAEVAAGTNPLLKDRTLAKGVAIADTTTREVDIQPYEQMTGTLVDDKYAELFTSPLAGNAETIRTFAGGTQIWPVVGDVNGDGLWDLIVCGQASTNVFVNVGSQGNPRFEERDVDCRGVVNLNMNSTDKLEDMSLDVETLGALSATTNGLTLLVSDDEGRIWYYKKNAEASSLTYRLLHKVWGGSFAGFAQGLMLAAVDWEDDGDLDCICGTADGKLMLLRDPKVGRPTNLKADAGVDNVLLTWDPNAQSRVRGYKVYRAVDESEDFSVRGVPSLPTFRDVDLQPSIYAYKVSALSRFYTAGNSTPTEYESESTEPVVTRVGGPTIVVGEPKRTVDGTVEIAVSINNSMNYNAEGTAITIPYDDENLAYQTTKPSGLSEKLNYKAVAADGKVVIEIESGEVMPGAGVFFTIVFKGLSNGVLMGDLDGNGKVDRDDLKLLAKLKSAAGRKYTDYQLIAGDFNQNGKLDNADYQMLRDLLKNKGEL